MKKIKGLLPYQILTKRETEITDLLIKGYTTGEISSHLNIKSNTVSTIKKNIFLKLKVDSVIELYKLLNN